MVYGLPNPPAGRIENRLLELPDGRVVSTRHHGKGQQAITEYETLRTHGKVSMVRVKLLTGRKHQIRSHLSERRTPIVGDTMYPVAPLAAAEDVWETVGGENGGRGRGKDEKTGPEEPGKNNSSENPSPLHSDRSTGVRGKPGSYCGAPASRTQGQRSRAARDAGVRKPDPVGHGRLLLAATRLGLDQPRTGRRLAFEIKLPPEFRQAITGQEQ